MKEKTPSSSASNRSSTPDNPPASAPNPDKNTESPMKLAFYLFGLPLLLLVIAFAVMNYFN